MRGEEILDRILPVIDFLRGGLTRPERAWLELHLKGKVVLDRKDVPENVLKTLDKRNIRL